MSGINRRKRLERLERAFGTSGKDGPRVRIWLPWNCRSEKPPPSVAEQLAAGGQIIEYTHAAELSEA
jgi:hypothetical protein